MASWVLIHSPLLGPGSWAEVAKRLGAAVPDLRPALHSERDLNARLADLTAMNTEPGSAIWLAGHSGAGPLLPLVAARLTSAGVRVEATVFVDAGLPHPGVSRRATLGRELAEHLDAISEDGWLPPWPQWWPEAELAVLVPDASMREALQADAPRIPVRLCDEPMPAGDDVPAPCYLQLSAAYAEHAYIATRHGWPVVRMDADHLAPLTRPDEVTAALHALRGPVSRAGNTLSRTVPDHARVSCARARASGPAGCPSPHVGHRGMFVFELRTVDCGDV